MVRVLSEQGPRNNGALLLGMRKSRKSLVLGAKFNAPLNSPPEPKFSNYDGSHIAGSRTQSLSQINAKNAVGIIRAVAGRILWNTRCTRCMEGIEVNHVATIQKIWHHMKTYLHAEWSKRSYQVKKGQTAMPEAHKQFFKDFGTDTRMFHFSSNQLVVSRLAPTNF
jgi:hypothetical protein